MVHWTQPGVTLGGGARRVLATGALPLDRVSAVQPQTIRAMVGNHGCRGDRPPAGRGS